MLAIPANLWFHNCDDDYKRVIKYLNGKFFFTSKTGHMRNKIIMCCLDNQVHIFLVVYGLIQRDGDILFQLICKKSALNKSCRLSSHYWLSDGRKTLFVSEWEGP